ncbi:MAG: LysR family transcriptional regulator [Tropicimonas sp.]|uniref:LysR family transcriptional regulator n=1 Tax=Tropicimonas sp. TaxID=2067044 RepID=UPI003A8BE83D
MTLEQLRIFLRVAELSHVTRAARALNLTQSAASASIAALERQYDVRLFDRVGRGIVLTEAGGLLVAAAERVLREAEAAGALLSGFAREPGGRLRIWASQTIASYWLTPYMMRMHRRWPQVELSLHAGNTAEVERAVQEGAADLGFVEGAVSAGHLRQRRVGHDELLLVMPRTHPLARKPRLAAEDYRAMDWLLREAGSGTRTVVERHLDAMGLAPRDLNVLLHLPTNEAILGGIRAGMAVSMLSWRSLRQAGRREFALRRITWSAKPRRSFLVLSDPQRHRSKAVESFLDFFDRPTPSAAAATAEIRTIPLMDH